MLYYKSMKAIYEKLINCVCGGVAEHLELSWGHMIRCTRCHKHKDTPHDYRAWYDDWSPDWAEINLRRAWNSHIRDLQKA